MVDEITISDYALNAPPRFRVVAEGDQTVIRAYDTNEPLWRINGKIGGGGVEDMTTTQRMSITPELGELIFDTTLGALFVGDGVTVGGIAVGGGEDDIPGNRLYSDGEFLNFNPVADIVNVSGSSVTLQPDTAYKILATTGAVNVTANPPAANKWAYEGHAEIFVGSVGYVVFDTSKIVLANQLEPDSVNNCTLRFHDGMCYISVEDHIAGYIVVNGSTSGSGSLAYGIATSTNDYIAFDAGLNGQTIPLAGAVAEGEKHVVGNGYTETAITGAVDCGTSKFTVANLSLQNVQVTGGTLTLGDAYIPSGSTVAVSSGGLAVEKVVGEGSDSVIDLGYDSATQSGGMNIVVENTKASIVGCVVSGGFSPDNGGALLLSGGATFSALDCIFTKNIGGIGGVFNMYGGTADFTRCTFSGNTTTNYGNPGRITHGGVCTMTDCIVSGGNAMAVSATLVISGGIFANGIIAYNGANIQIAGSASLKSITSRGPTGSVTITSGAILDLTGNTNATPIAPGGGITFASGGATVKVGDSTASSSYMLDNVTLPAGAKLTNTNVVDLGSSYCYLNGRVAQADGCVFTNGSANNGGAFRLVSGAECTLNNCLVSGNSGGATGGGISIGGGTMTITGTTVTGNSCVNGAGVFVNDTLVASSSIISGNVGENDIRFTSVGAVVSATDCVLGDCSVSSGTLTLSGSNTIEIASGKSANINLTSGAILDLTGNENATPIKPGGGVIVDGGCQVITSAGTTVSIAGGTYTKINNDGTTE